MREKEIEIEDPRLRFNTLMEVDIKSFEKFLNLIFQNIFCSPY